MTWSFARVEPSIAAAVTAAALTGCIAADVEETQIVLVAETAACEVARTRGSRVNAYRVLVFDFGGFMSAGTDAPCIECIRSGDCPVRRQTCVCGGRRPPATVTINQQLDGLRFEDVPPNRPYCVGIIGYDVPDLPVDPDAESPEECDCAFGLASEMELGPFNRICGVSPFPGVVEENAPAVFVQVDCRPGCPAITGR